MALSSGEEKELDAMFLSDVDLDLLDLVGVLGPGPEESLLAMLEKRPIIKDGGFCCCVLGKGF